MEKEKNKMRNWKKKAEGSGVQVLSQVNPGDSKSNFNSFLSHWLGGD